MVNDTEDQDDLTEHEGRAAVEINGMAVKRGKEIDGCGV
jgi:hypothetical protein